MASPFHNRNHYLAFSVLGILLTVLFSLDLLLGSTHIDVADIVRSLFGTGTPHGEIIVMQFRLPKALTALIAGAAMSLSGLLMQTLFRNPLAGPDVLGVSSGAGLGVAIMVLAISPFVNAASSDMLHGWTQIFAAWAGAGVVMMIILTISSRVRDIMTVLIIGILLASAISSVVSLLQYFSNESVLKTYVIWTMGNLGNLSPAQIKVLLISVLAGTLLALSRIKPLNALLMGETFSKSVGVNLRQTRVILLASASILAGSITAFCGPLAFIGIAVPHITRIIFGSTDHRILVPGVLMTGSAVVLLSDILSTLPGAGQIIPVNTVTSLIGIPVVLWIVAGQSGIIKRK